MGVRERFCSLLRKLQTKHERLSFNQVRKSDEGADTDLVYDFCLPKQELNSAYFHLTSLNSNENVHTAA